MRHRESNVDPRAHAVTMLDRQPDQPGEKGIRGQDTTRPECYEEKMKT